MNRLWICLYFSPAEMHSAWYEHRTWYGKYAFEQSKINDRKLLKSRVQCTVYGVYFAHTDDTKKKRNYSMIIRQSSLFDFFFVQIYYRKIEFSLWLDLPFRWWFIWCNLYQPIGCTRRAKRKKPNPKKGETIRFCLRHIHAFIIHLLIEQKQCVALPAHPNIVVLVDVDVSMSMTTSIEYFII